MHVCRLTYVNMYLAKFWIFYANNITIIFFQAEAF